MTDLRELLAKATCGSSLGDTYADFAARMEARDDLDAMSCDLAQSVLALTEENARLREALDGCVLLSEQREDYGNGPNEVLDRIETAARAALSAGERKGD